MKKLNDENLPLIAAELTERQSQRSPDQNVPLEPFMARLREGIALMEAKRAKAKNHA